MKMPIGQKKAAFEMKNISILQFYRCGQVCAGRRFCYTGEQTFFVEYLRAFLIMSDVR